MRDVRLLLVAITVALLGTGTDGDPVDSDTAKRDGPQHHNDLWRRGAYVNDKQLLDEVWKRDGHDGADVDDTWKRNDDYYGALLSDTWKRSAQDNLDLLSDVWKRAPAYGADMFSELWKRNVKADTKKMLSRQGLRELLSKGSWQTALRHAMGFRLRSAKTRSKEQPSGATGGASGTNVASGTSGTSAAGGDHHDIAARYASLLELW